jgi:hypothetical protein
MLKIATTNKKYLKKSKNKKEFVENYKLFFISIVTGLGLEPRTLSLKGRCSTN